jgi:hypothetical protein
MLRILTVFATVAAMFQPAVRGSDRTAEKPQAIGVPVRAEIDRPQPLQMHTPILKAKRVSVAAPSTSHGQRAAQAVRRALAGLGGRAELLPKPDYLLANMADGDAKGWLYYLTGDPKVGEEYRRAWKAYIACGYARTARVPQPHLFSLNRVVPWRLVEDMGLFSEDERLACTTNPTSTPQPGPSD